MDKVKKKIMKIDEAIALIKDGDMICINSFLAIANPAELNSALTKRVVKTGSPKNLKIFCSSGFGNWTENSDLEGYIKAGAVDKLVLGHFSSMPDTCKKIIANEVEAYNLPLGVMSHMIRAAASKKSVLRSKIGLNLFVDPRQNKYGMNERSKEEWVRLVKEDGQEMLEYKVPKFDVAIIKGSSADLNGNISFEDECATVDALSTAQAVKANGGKVIVQVARILEKHQRPRDVIIPNVLVDAIVICKDQKQIITVAGYNASLSGDVYVHGNEMYIWSKILQESLNKKGKEREAMHTLIGQRAFAELKKGHVANIGIGIPELVGTEALNANILTEISLSVEVGSIGGLPAGGTAFGATIGADIIVDMAQHFDFYEGGGLDICFIGALEVDRFGNVNGHYSEGKISGIGGFANITQSSKKVVFCLTFSAKGLKVDTANNEVKILSEGKYPKFVKELNNISFSFKNALASNQEVLYVTERCVFKLTEKGLELIEVAKGIDMKKDILDQLPFEVQIADNIKYF